MKNTVITPQTFSGLRQSWQRGSPTAHGVWRFSRRALSGAAMLRARSIAPVRSGAILFLPTTRNTRSGP